jgi:hypothetical protein
VLLGSKLRRRGRAPLRQVLPTSRETNGASRYQRRYCARSRTAMAQMDGGARRCTSFGDRHEDFLVHALELMGIRDAAAGKAGQRWPNVVKQFTTSVGIAALPAFHQLRTQLAALLTFSVRLVHSLAATKSYHAAASVPALFKVPQDRPWRSGKPAFILSFPSVSKLRLPHQFVSGNFCRTETNRPNNSGAREFNPRMLTECSSSAGLTRSRHAFQEIAPSGARENRRSRMNRTKAASAVTMLASAVAVAFLATPSYAQGMSSSGEQQAQVKCIGGNSCKGQSACKTASSPGPGQNSCKGQGFVMASSAQECTEKGGHPETSKM